MRILKRRRAAWVAICCLLGGEAAWSHGGHQNRVPVLGPLPEAFAGIEIELTKTLGYQLIVANEAGRSVEVLGRDGVAFLRIDAEGVHANLAARGWYESFTAAGSAMPAALAGGAERWTLITPERTWGWFDPRLRKLPDEPPHPGKHGTEPGGLARWSIPVRVDDEPASLGGHFRSVPTPRGRVHARLRSSAEPRPGLSVQILAGPHPGLYLAYGGAEPLVVRGLHDEPFLRIGSDGVHANVRSETWRRSGRAEVSFEQLAPVEAGSAPLWERKSRTPRYSWLEPRAFFSADSLPEAASETNAPTELLRWSVPIDLGGETFAIRGLTEWVPAGGGNSLSAGGGRAGAAGSPPRR